MRRGAKSLGFSALLAIAACDSKRPELTVRSTGRPPAAQAGPVSARVADGRAQLALGNVALALETFRRAVREEPRNIDAITGLAASYDRMGRFDVSRRHYEAALAVEPANREALAGLAASLDLQGKASEAQAVRGEIDRRDALQTASLAERPPQAAPARKPAAEAAEVRIDVIDEVGAPAPVREPPALSVATATAPAASPFPTAPAREVTVMLAAPRPPAAAPAPPAVAAPAPLPSLVAAPVKARLDSAPRLERTSMAEVSLVTRRAEPMARPATLRNAEAGPAVRFVPLRAAPDRVAVRVLNAARVDRLAATTRILMLRRGWSNIVIGDAATTRARSIVLYPARLRVAARRIAAQLGLRSAFRAGRGEVTVLLGSDAAALVRRRAAS